MLFLMSTMLVQGLCVRPSAAGLRRAGLARYHPQRARTLVAAAIEKSCESSFISTGTRSARRPDEPALLGARWVTEEDAQRIRYGGGELEFLQLEHASTADWARVAHALAPFSRENRLQRLQEILQKRRGGIHLVLENVADPFNCAAVLRTAEGLGVQHIHVIESVSEFRLPAGETSSASRGALGNVAMGASRWLSVHKYRHSFDCYDELRRLGVRIVASDCPPSESEEENGVGWETQKAREFSASPIDEIDFPKGEGVAIVLGNERRGVSRALVERSDAAFYLPMCGLTQSCNISVAAAVALYAVLSSGSFPQGSLDEEEQVELLGKWLLRDVKAAKPLLRKAGIEFVDF